MIFSANDLCTTRLCQAHNCPDDAQLGWALCEHHEKRRLAGKPITLHTPPQPETTLPCCNCGQWKPDDQFGTRKPPRASRRGRHSECRQCAAQRRKQARTNMHADILEELRAYDRNRKATS